MAYQLTHSRSLTSERSHSALSLISCGRRSHTPRPRRATRYLIGRPPRPAVDIPVASEPPIRGILASCRDGRTTGTGHALRAAITLPPRNRHDRTPITATALLDTRPEVERMDTPPTTGWRKRTIVACGGLGPLVIARRPRHCDESGVWDWWGGRRRRLKVGRFNTSSPTDQRLMLASPTPGVWLSARPARFSCQPNPG